MAGIAILLAIIVLLVVVAIGLAIYGTGSLERWSDGEMERRR